MITEEEFGEYNPEDNKSNYEEAYHEGWEAFHDNKKLESNPYSLETKKGMGWKDGFESARDEFFDHDYEGYK